MQKLKKWANAFKGYTSCHNVEILNSFDSELKCKDTESAINNKPIDLFTQLRGFEFVTTLVLKSLKRYRVMIMCYTVLFIWTQKHKNC